MYKISHFGVGPFTPELLLDLTSIKELHKLSNMNTAQDVKIVEK